MSLFRGLNVAWFFAQKHIDRDAPEYIQLVRLKSRSKTRKLKQNKRLWSPCVFIYDAGACTKEEHDPAKAVLYHRPRNVSVDSRTAISGQLAGVAHFCRSVFTTPTYVKTKCGHVSLKHYGRFMLMVCGKSRKWSESRLASVSRLLDSATGGIPALWVENPDKEVFSQRLTSLMDAILFHALPDVKFEDGICPWGSSSSSPSSSCYSASSEVLEEASPEPGKGGGEHSLGGALWRRMRSQEAEVAKPVKPKEVVPPQPDEEAVLATLHRELSAVPFVTLPKSGASSFLRAQQLLQTCQQHSGVLAGSTSYKNRVLNSQLDLEMQLVLSSLNGIDCEENGIFQKRKHSYQLPKGVVLYSLNVPTKTMRDIYKSIPKISLKRGDRRGLHSHIPQSTLSSLRSALHNNSLHSSPSSIPPCGAKPCEEASSRKGPIDPLLLCTKISKNGDLLSDGRPSKSLPGSPRKIRVATMLPDVGSNSPELRYKVLTARRQKPVASTTNTPRRIQGMRNGNGGKGGDAQNGGILMRGNNLAAPSLKRKEFLLKADKMGNGILDASSQMDKENIHALCQNQFGDRPNNELNIKNTKNKLNLHFAPDKVNRPSEDYDEEEEKIAREINGSLSKDDMSREMSRKSLNSQLIDIHDDDDESRSEESEISVLELSAYAESKENGNRLFEEANKLDSPRGNFVDDGFESYSDPVPTNLGSSSNISDHQWTNSTLYVQKTSNMALHFILDNEAAADQLLVYNIFRLASMTLPEIEKSLLKTLEISEEKEGDIFLQKSSSALFAVDLAALHSSTVEMAHQDFQKNPFLTEVTFREDDIVLWSHRNHSTETFYQCSGASRPGLPIPSDAMARVPHRARRRLERDYGITLL